MRFLFLTINTSGRILFRLLLDSLVINTTSILHSRGLSIRSQSRDVLSMSPLAEAKLIITRVSRAGNINAKSKDSRIRRSPTTPKDTEMGKGKGGKKPFKLKGINKEGTTASLGDQEGIKNASPPKKVPNKASIAVERKKMLEALRVPIYPAEEASKRKRESVRKGEKCRRKRL